MAASPTTATFQRRHGRLLRLCQLCLGVVWLAGCGPGDTGSSALHDTEQETLPPRQTQPLAPGQANQPPRGTPDGADIPVELTVPANSRASWAQVYLAGQPVGYQQTVWTGGASLSDPPRELQELLVLDQPLATREWTREVQNEDGKVVSLELWRQTPTERTSILANIQADQCVLRHVINGQTENATFAWTNLRAGIFALEQELKRQPLKPATERVIHVCVLDNRRQVPLVLSARPNWHKDQTQFPGKQLLPVNFCWQFDHHTELSGTLWQDETGEIWLTEYPAAQLCYVRADRQAALAPRSPLNSRQLLPEKIVLGNSADQGLDLGDLHSAKRITFLLQHPRQNPADWVASRPWQTVVPVDAQSCRVTVTRSRLTDAAPISSAYTASQDSAPYLAANRWLELDDPAIRQLAAEIRDSADQSPNMAQRIAATAQQRIQPLGTNHNFLSAAQALRQGRGDCSEYSTLFVALARASGLPARGCVGLVWMPGERAFSYHMWSECYQQGVWQPLDASFNRSELTPGYLQFDLDPLADSTTELTFLKLFSMKGLKITVENLEKVVSKDK